MSLKLLVVDDYPPSAEMLSLVMEMKGYDVRHTYKAATALEILKTFIPDVVLCDINMPEISGYDLCMQIRKDERLKNTLFIAQTGLSVLESGKQVRDAGFHHHLVKPLDIGVLSHIIDQHVGNMNAQKTSLSAAII